MAREPADAAVPRRGFLKAAVTEAAQTAAAMGGATARQAAGSVGGPVSDAAKQLAALAGVSFSDIVVLDSPVADDRANERGGPGGSAALAGAGAGAGVGYRSPFRLEGDALIVLDQRRFPGAVVEVPCLTAADAAEAIREGLAQGAGTIAAVGSYALAGAAAERARNDHDLTAAAALAAIHADADTLLAAAPWVASLRNALDVLVARAREAAGRGSGPSALAAVLRRTTDTTTMEELLGLSRLVAAGIDLLRVHATERRSQSLPLRVLLHGAVGSLSFGQVGTAAGAVHGAASTGIPVYAWIDEARPGLSGVRTAWELSHAGVGYWLVPDASVGGVLAAGSVDLVLTGALGVTRDGSVVDDPGAYAIAALAARHEVPVYVCAPRQTLFTDRATPSPRYDVVPADLISGFVTDAGILKAPFGPSLAALAPARSAGS